MESGNDTIVSEAAVSEDEVAQWKACVSDAEVERWVHMMEEDEGWQCVGESKGVHQRPAEAKLRPTRCAVEMECGMEPLLKLLHEEHPMRHGEWNNTYRGGLVRKLDPKNEYSIQQWMYEQKGLKNRDFLVIHRCFHRDDGSVVLVERSVVWDAVPVPAGFIRCNLRYNVRLLKPLDDGQRTHYTYMNVTELGGWLPAFLVNKANPKVSMEETQHIKAVCEEAGHGGSGESRL